MTDTKPFDGKLALVTGASRGIGAATAEALAAAGAHVILTARGATALEQVEERIHAAGGNATIAPMDLNDHENIAQAGPGRRRALGQPRHPRPQRRDARQPVARSSISTPRSWSGSSSSTSSPTRR